MEVLAENEYITFWDDEGEVLGQRFKVSKIGLEEAESIVALRHTVQKDQLLFFVDISKVASVSKEARDYFASSYATDKVIAVAFYTSSIISRMLVTFFLAFNRPNVPSKIFSDENEAMLWLRQQKDKK